MKKPGHYWAKIEKDDDWEVILVEDDSTVYICGSEYPLCVEDIEIFGVLVSPPEDSRDGEVL